MRDRTIILMGLDMLETFKKEAFLVFPQKYVVAYYDSVIQPN